MMIFTALALVLLLSVDENGVEACNGYKLKIEYVRNCFDNNLIKVEDGENVSLDEDCNLSFNGCIDFTKEIKTAKATYSIQKPPLPEIAGTFDLCDLSQFRKVKPIAQLMSLVGLSENCPYPKKKICAKGTSINLAPYKDVMGMAAGDTSLKLNIDHDNGEKSCIELKFNLTGDKS